MLNLRTKTIGAIALTAAWMLSAPVATAQQCVGDGNGDNEVTIEELVSAVGNALEGCDFSSGMVTVSGLISDPGESYRVWATGDLGTAFLTDCDPDTGRFTLLLPSQDWYVLGFGHFHGHAEMHFAGHMVFPCEGGEDDHFFLGGGEHDLDLGTVSLNEDGSFARPTNNPLDLLDHDGDGMHDIDDPDMHCEDVGDHNHDGFYDDDMDHDGFHDGDMNHDGHLDDGHHGHHGQGPGGGHGNG